MRHRHRFSPHTLTWFLCGLPGFSRHTTTLQFGVASDTGAPSSNSFTRIFQQSFHALTQKPEAATVPRRMGGSLKECPARSNNNQRGNNFSRSNTPSTCDAAARATDFSSYRDEVTRKYVASSSTAANLAHHLSAAWAEVRRVSTFPGQKCDIHHRRGRWLHKHRGMFNLSQLRKMWQWWENDKARS